MREKMMPDILPSLFRFEIEVHTVFERVQKNPPKEFMLTEDRKRSFYEKIYDTKPHREVRLWCQDAILIVETIKE